MPRPVCAHVRARLPACAPKRGAAQVRVHVPARVRPCASADVHGHPRRRVRVHARTYACACTREEAIG